MLEMAEVTNRSQVQQYCKALSLPFGDEKQAFDALDKDEICGFCIFRIQKDTVYIEGLFSQTDFGTSLYDGLLRAVMNFASSRGIKNVYLEMSIGREILNQIEPLHFIKNTPMDIEDFFKTFRNCKK